VTGGRRFSQAVSEGDGISLIATVRAPEEARKAEADGAEAVLVASGAERQLHALRAATTLPILFHWGGERAEQLDGADACVVEAGDRDREWLQEVHDALGDRFELALRIHHEDHLEEVLENFDPELFVLAAPDEDDDPLEHVLELLPDVPAGKLAIAELPVAGPREVAELERAGVDAVIVGATNVSELVGDAPPTL
jgi:NAD(P)H-dependent flavin oxidoreductase YrpB (nitropropane dioxygenase family)